MGKKKYERLAAVKEILNGQIISNQEEILIQLNQRGFEVTQATMSRDIKELKIAKVPINNGAYRYVLPENAIDMRGAPATAEDSERLLRIGVRSIEFAGQLAVMKTHPGYAGAAAALIDSLRVPEIMGTLAGDDTVLIILRPEYTVQHVVKSMSEHIPNIQSKLI